MARSYCHITVYPDSNQWVRLDFGLNQEFVKAIKVIPAYDRHYDAEGRFWSVHPFFLNLIRGKALACFEIVIEIRNGQAVYLKPEKAG